MPSPSVHKPVIGFFVGCLRGRLGLISSRPVDGTACQTMFNMLMISVVACCSLFGAVRVRAGKQSLLNGNDPATWTGMVKLNHDIKRSGDASFELYGKYPTEMICSEMIPIDMGRVYTLSAWMRSLNGELPASAYMGLRMYDQNKRPIVINNVVAFPDTQTALASTAEQGARRLSVVMNPRWRERDRAVVAFNVDEDFRDLPNFDISPAIESFSQDGENLVVELKSPLRKTYPAGTKVRLHSPWGAPFYWAAQGWLSAEWKHCSWSLSGEAKHGAAGDAFWTGTRYARFFIWFGNWNRRPEEGARLLVDGIEFTSVPIPKVSGSLKLPEQWHVFGPFETGDHVDAGALKAVPEVIRLGDRIVPAEMVKAVNNRIDLRQVYESFGHESVAYVFGMITVPETGKVTLGMGADWWMRAWIDGKVVCDTTASGNTHWPPTINDHVFVSELSQGEHLLAIRVIGGKASSALAIGGPDQLRAFREAFKSGEKRQNGQSGD